MKKTVTFLLALTILLCGAFLAKPAFLASAKISPTAPTITDTTKPTTGPDIPTVPSYPHVSTTGTTSYTITTGTTTPSTGTTGPTATKPTTSPSTGTTGPSTTPDGSTITGPVTPDDNPDAPKTGETSTEVFAFAGIAFACTAAALLVRKNKDADAQ